MSKAVEFKNVCFSYIQDDNENYFLNNINLSIDENSYLALIGKNGSGKSTLIKLMFGIEKANKGEIKIFDMNINEKAYEIYKIASLVFQNPDDQIVADTIELDIAFTMENYSIPSKEMHKRIDEVLEIVELSNKRKDKVHSLSGGEKQRLCIASSLVLNPKILVLDEPTSMLDAENRMKVIEVLNKIHSMGTTIIIVTHHINEIEHCNEVVFMDNGSVSFKGSSDEFVRALIKNDEFHKLNMPINFKLAYELYKNKNVLIDKDIFNYKKVCESLWKYV
ncbi:energy-coupling factor ABC transporter ATP-binding protein [Brachyspira murdochii]|uniref:ABC transporter related protein n=1 Tax=Brachyspira murdochii (strain ATCC 51284 / DSM 12563 / 56-150) TaxID=526224 RepID=D5U7G2_BRAM5|nr:ATP-binding cassette domain-containing protein [Brachyspira murdochii]ADG70750.1 ABC transporter related protein [Brachyspira murdochii DSM 12563]